MDLTNLRQLKFFLKSNNLWTKKRFGQNFLVNRNVLNKIVGAARIGVPLQDLVIEIGPGLGILTEELAKKAKKVIAIEKDRKLIPLLQERLKEYKNVEIINEDALKFEPPESSYKVVANIPYYITSPLINYFLKDRYIKRGRDRSRPVPTSASPNSPILIIILTQKEVAQKICAKPPKLNILALNVQTFGKPEIISYVKKENFYPKPKVDSAILKITPYKKPAANCNLEKFFKLIHSGFAKKRKKLYNSLPPELNKEIIKKANIDPNRRAETLRIDEWEKLTNLTKSKRCHKYVRR